MTRLDLQTIGGDVAAILECLNAGDTEAARQTTVALGEYVICLARRTEEGNTYTSYAQNKFLAVLTGYGVYPPKYWQDLRVTRAEASDFINEIKLEGAAELKGKRYIKLQTEAKERNYQKRKRVAA
jgi:hypothetical protein